MDELAASYSLDGRVCLVTGAVEGIGLATSELLAERGGHVIMAGRVDDDRLKTRVDALEQKGYSVEGIVCDVVDPQQVADCYRRLFQAHRRLDVLVANAGVLGDAKVGMISEDLLHDTLQVNLAGVIRHIQAAARLMRRSDAGSIIATSSIIGSRGNPGQIPYSASKAGVVGAVLSAAKELGPVNIRVNAIAPGYIETRMIEHLAAPVHAERLNQIGLGRAGQPREVAELIAFLASDAASYISGQVIGVDGMMVI